jgi:hypothetical protein
MSVKDEIQRLEMLSESIQSEINELQSLLENSDEFLLKSKRATIQKQLADIISNLEDSNDSVYGVFEELNAEDTESLQEEHHVMKEMLNERLSYDEKTYFGLKYHIDFWEV